MEEIEFLKDLQRELINQDNDCQADPRFWVVMDYRTIPGNEDYDSGHDEYFFNDGDFVKFDDCNSLKEFLREYYEDEINESKELQELINDESNYFDELWEYVEDNLNSDGFFDKAFVKEEEYIVPNTMFLTKTEAKRHIDLNHYHYSPKAHTYAMTAWRAPKVEKLLKILETFDWDSL